MKMNQLLKLRGELTSSLAIVQAAIEAQFDAEQKARAEKRATKRAASPKGEPRTPSHDPRVADVRAIMRDMTHPSAQIFNNLRKSGDRCIKLWHRVTHGRADTIQSRVAECYPDATFDRRQPPYGDGIYLCVILPAC